MSYEADVSADIRKGVSNSRYEAMLLFYARQADKEIAGLEERLAAAERERTRINEIIGHDGPDTADQVEKEWHDYMMVVGECTKVYEHFSGLTKPNTAAEHVISFGDEREQKRIDAAVAEAEEVYKDQLAAAELRATRAEADGAAMRLKYAALAQAAVDHLSNLEDDGDDLDVLLGDFPHTDLGDHPGADLLAVVSAAREMRTPRTEDDPRADVQKGLEDVVRLDAALAKLDGGAE